jgi:hypothetical protein
MMTYQTYRATLTVAAAAVWGHRRFARVISSKVLLAAVIIMIACSDATGPGSIPGTFVLRSVNGESLPFTPRGPLIDPSHSVVAGTVTLDADGTATLVERRRFFGQPTDEIVTRVAGYRLDGQRITIGPPDCPRNTICEPRPCPPNEVCINVKGVVINSSLSLRAPFDSDFNYVYQLVTVEN